VPLASKTKLAIAYSGGQVVISWAGMPGATGYSATFAHLPAQQVGTNQAVFPATELPRGVPLTATVVTLDGAFQSPVPSVTQVTLVDPPTGIAASYTGGQLTASWTAVAGAASYLVQVLDPSGQVLVTQRVGAAAINYGGAEIVPGVSYSVRVAASSTVDSPYSAQVPDAQDTFTVMCLGTTPGYTCVNGAFTDVAQNVTRHVVDNSYAPARSTNRTGWVAVPPGRVGHVAVLCQLLIKLTTSYFLTEAEAYSVFATGRVTASNLGTLTCLCLGMTPGGGCGNGATGAYTGEIWTGLSQSIVDGSFRPANTNPRTGWVVVDSGPYDPLEVMLQLAGVLGGQGKLGPTSSWDVFNNTTSVKITADTGGGGTTCLALGAPVGSPCKTMNGKAGDIAVNLTSGTLAAYQPGASSGWAAIGQAPYSVETALLRIVVILANKGILSGSQPYDIFNNARTGHLT